MPPGASLNAMWSPRWPQWVSFGRMWKRAVPLERSEVEWCLALLRTAWMTAELSGVAIGAALDWPSLDAGSGHDDRGIALCGNPGHGGKATRRSAAEAHPPPLRECAAKGKSVHVGSVRKDDVDLRLEGAQRELA